LAAYYRAADFLIICSHSEGWPTVIFEALACGVPVIAHSVGGIPEALSSPEIGLLTKNNSSPTLVAAIASAYARNWDQGKAIAMAARNTWEEIARQYLKIYTEVNLQRQ
jgi:teichuronic acid biosynthesis glycosyltransferase TuaC